MIKLDVHSRNSFLVTMGRFPPSGGGPEITERYTVIARNDVHALQIAKSFRPGYRLKSVKANYTSSVLMENAA